MKKNVAVAVVFLLLIAAVAFLVFPKSADKGGLPFADEGVKDDFSDSIAVSDDAFAGQKEDKAKSRLKASFDIVRVEEDGSMIAAGKGVAGVNVSLMDGESVLTDFTVNEDGEWVYIPAEPLVVGAHEIWLRDDSMNGREESEVVVVDVPEPKNAGESLAVMLSVDSDDVNVMQAPAPKVEAGVDIRSVNYAKGAFVIRGNAVGGGRVNLYMDNLFLGNVRAKGEEWSLRVAKKLVEGRQYIIRADKVDAKGKVVARVEVPFGLEKGLESAKSRRVRVIKGDCLWTIAKNLYGSGMAYVTIYQANKKQIKNPDLIYPNQVFVLPVKSGK